MDPERFQNRTLIGLVASLVAFTHGCALHTADIAAVNIGQSPIPRELSKTTLPIYRIEPPDILLIQSVDNIRRSTAPLEPGDKVYLRLQNGLPISPEIDRSTEPERFQAEYELKFINGEYTVNAAGELNLGPEYGVFKVAGRTTDDARMFIEQELIKRDILLDPKIQLELSSLAGKQPVDGQHLVRPDGTVGLGIYGDVYVTGMTLDEARCAIESHLSNFMEDPEIAVDILAYNSKVIYIIMDGGGFGEQIIRLPCTGNETVLDAIAQVNGLSRISSKRVWVARPAPGNVHRTQILDVHWQAITAEGITTTNYQLLPGDRIYVQADKLMATDNYLSKVLAPVERIFGIILLGKSAKEGPQGN